jgi:hypothetical protein
MGLPWKFEKKYKERAELTHRFMQPYYYKMIKAVLDESSKRNMIIDLTISSSWPASGVHISKEDSLKVLLIGQKVVKGPKQFNGKIPKFKKPLIYRLMKLSKFLVGIYLLEYFYQDMELEAIVAAKPLKKSAKLRAIRVKPAKFYLDSFIDLTDKVNEQGLLEWDIPEGKWQIFTFYKGPSGFRPFLDSRSDPDKLSLVVDHLSSKPIENHLDQHIGEGKKYFNEHFGKTLRAYFTDSLELSSEWFWTDDFLSEFEKRRGYDLTPFIPVCCVPNRDNTFFIGEFLSKNTPIIKLEDDIGNRIRYDFEMTISDLFTEKFVHEMTKWANENKLKNRIQAYGIRVDTLKSYGIAHIPETEQLYAGGIINFLKLAGSAGILYDKPIITAEAMVWNQRDYMTTPLKWKVAADRLFISGINQMIYHGFPYQSALFPYPGYCAFSTPYHFRRANFSSNFSRMNPFWEFFPIINKYVARCQYILQHGKIISNVGIFYPLFNYSYSVLKIEELTGGYLDEYDGALEKRVAHGRTKKRKNWTQDEKWTKSIIDLGDQLTAYGYYYAQINEESILNGKVENKRLKIGNGNFEVLIFLNTVSISFKLANRLKKLTDSGLKIIFINKLPIEQNNFLNYKENDKIISEITRQLIDSNKATLIDGIPKVIQLLYNELDVKPGIRFNEYQPDISYIHKATENCDLYFIRHSKNQPKKVKIRFPHPNKVPFLLNPWSGNISQAVQYKKFEEEIEIDLFFEAYGSLIIEFKEASEDLYVLQSQINLKRDKGGIVGYTKNSGEFLFNISDGTEKTIHRESKTPESIPIKRWHFITNNRDHLGTFTPFETDFEDLKDWHDIPELKYCSSRGFYFSTFSLSDEHIRENLKLTLLLERVHDVAVVKINNNECPPLMIYPYKVDITPYVNVGENAVEIEVTPTIRNRLLGYGRKGGKKWKNHKKKKGFMPSGIIGPIKIDFDQKLKIL